MSRQRRPIDTSRPPRFSSYFGEDFDVWRLRRPSLRVAIPEGEALRTDQVIADLMMERGTEIEDLDV